MAEAVAVPEPSIDLLRAAKRSDSTPKEWSEDKMRRSVQRYRKFLHLAVKFPDRPLAPTRDIDVMWHLHMMHPVAYYQDCQRLMGAILDHDGGFGKEPEEVPVLTRHFDETARLWKAEFGEDYVTEEDLDPDQSLTSCWHDCQGRCHHACKSQPPA